VKRKVLDFATLPIVNCDYELGRGREREKEEEEGEER
jgi:hypothetical protein